MKKYKTVTILFFSLFLLVCSKTKNPVKNPPSNLKFESSQSECKGSLNPKMEGSANNDTVIFSSHGDTILVIHQNAFYNCCAKIEVKVTQTLIGFDLSESDTGLPCDCLCPLDITTMISGLSPGSYLIRVFDIDSNLVGSGMVDIPPKYTGFESSQSKCKNHTYKMGGEAVSNTIEDSVLVWSHADTVWVMHKNDIENCAAIVKTKIERTVRGFDIYEYYVERGNAYCICYFDITTMILGVAPGTYLIRVFDAVGNLVDSVAVDIPPKYTGFGTSQSECKEGWGKINAETSSQDTLVDSIVVWSNGDTAWVTHKNAFYNCCSAIVTQAERTPEGFNLYEDDMAIYLCHCMCYFDITTTIYGLSPGIYLIRVFDTGGDLVGELEMVMPSP